MQPLLYIQLNMQLVLQNIIPVPLKEKLLQRSSSIWNKQLLFKKGEWIKINAPSGSGKTTFIHTLYKLRNDYEGTVQYDEKDIRQINANDLAVYRQQKISIVFQDLRLFPNITARENIELNRVMQTPLYEENKIDEMASTVVQRTPSERRTCLSAGRLLYFLFLQQQFSAVIKMCIFI